MKKTDKLLSAAVLTAAALCTSCSTDELTTQQQGQGETKAVSLTATLNEAATRAGMNRGTDDNTASFYWHNKDSILVQTVKTSDNTYHTAKFITTDKTGATTATFWGDAISSGATLGKYAVYPYNEKHQFTDKENLTYNLPATYTYTTVDNGIFSNTVDDVTTYRTNSTNIPMYGTITDGNVAFNYLGGVAVIRIDQMPYTSGTLTVSADQQLSGNFSVDLSGTTPALATTTTETEADKTVTFTFYNASTTSAGVFYLPLATGSYTGVKIVIASTDNASVFSTVNYGTLDVARASVTAIGLYNESGKIYAKDADGKYIIDGHKFVDLGLSVLWAETNIGADNAEDYGDYYAWGEVIAYDEQTTSGKKTNYSWSTYKWTTTTDGSSFTKYTTNGKTVLDKEDDAAYVNWGSSCRMPTKAEIDELTNTANCNWVLSSDKKGSTVTSRKTNYTNNSIFLPASGYRNGESFDDQGDYGRYWSSSLHPNGSNFAYDLYFDSDGHSHGSDGNNRYVGYAVRPVAEK